MYPIIYEGFNKIYLIESAEKTPPSGRALKHELQRVGVDVALAASEE
jgi:hypothetical protein